MIVISTDEFRLLIRNRMKFWEDKFEPEFYEILEHYLVDCYADGLFYHEIEQTIDSIVDNALINDFYVMVSVENGVKEIALIDARISQSVYNIVKEYHDPRESFTKRGNKRFPKRKV